MEDGKPHMNIIVIHGSGSGELTGIAGKIDIIIEAGKHSYVFEYHALSPVPTYCAAQYLRLETARGPFLSFGRHRRYTRKL